MSYIQNKLDELIDTYRKETGFTEYDARIIAERLVADYHDRIVEKVTKNYIDGSRESDFSVNGILSLLQDTNPNE